MSEFYVDTHKAKLNISLIHHFLSSQSTWAKGIPLSVVEKSIEHSLCFGGYVHNTQVAFARVISDFSTYAYLLDVFVLEAYRGNGFSKQLVKAVMSHPQLQDLRRFSLATSTASGLYAQFGFTPLANPQIMMERHFPSLYENSVR